MDLAPTLGIGGGTNDLVAVTGDLTVNGNNITISAPTVSRLTTGLMSWLPSPDTVPSMASLT
jgi:hypothetical protein